MLESLKNDPVAQAVLFFYAMIVLIAVGKTFHFLEKRWLDNAEQNELFKDVSRLGRFGKREWWKSTIRNG